jgi:hypothetical protein
MDSVCCLDYLSCLHRTMRLTRSSGVTIVCVGPHAMIPPTVHAAKYEPEKSSIFLCGFIASNLFAIMNVV